MKLILDRLSENYKATAVKFQGCSFIEIPQLFATRIAFGIPANSSGREELDFPSLIWMVCL